MAKHTYTAADYTDDLQRKDALKDEIINMMSLPTWHPAEKRRFHQIVKQLSDTTDRIMYYETNFGNRAN